MDPREKVLRDFFRNLMLYPDSTSRVEKVNLFPNTDFLFLDMDRVIQLGELNKKFKDHYVTIDEFISRLLEGKFSVGSGMSLKLKELNDKVETIIEEFDEKSKMEEDIIEEDLNNLKELYTAKIEAYFEQLKERLKSAYHEQNSELKESLIEARKTLKEELLSVINSSEFFDKNKFFVEFDGLKKKPLELEKFLKDYVNNEKTLQFNKSLDENIKKLSPVFHANYSLDDKLVKYVLNIEKLEPKNSPDLEDNGIILERFVDQTIAYIDGSLKRLKHFTIGEDQDLNTANLSQQVLKSPAKNPSANVSRTAAGVQNSSVKSPMGSKVLKGSIGSKEKPKKVNEIPLIRFKNPEDLAYDYGKFAGCSIVQVNLELHGDRLNQKSSDYMGRFLSSVARIERLTLNLSVCSITRESLDPVSDGLSKLKNLRHIEIDFGRCKIETEAFETFCAVLAGIESLRSISLSFEK